MDGPRPSMGGSCESQEERRQLMYAIANIQADGKVLIINLQVTPVSAWKTSPCHISKPVCTTLLTSQVSWYLSANDIPEFCEGFIKIRLEMYCRSTTHRVTGEA